MNERWRLWGLRLLALGLAILAWFFVSVKNRESTSEKVIEATVTYNTPGGFMILDPVEKVRVRVKGSTSRVRNLNPFLVDVLVELQEVRRGAVSVNLGPKNVIMPDGLEVVSIDPNQIRLTVDREVTRMLPVEAKLVGEPAAGAIVEEPEVQPEQVMVRGPESRLGQIDTLTTAPVDLDGHALDFQEQVAVLSPDPLITVVQPSLVTVKVPLKVPAAGAGNGAD